MNVLIIEDDPIKSAAIREFLPSVLDGCVIGERRSYQSGLKEALLGRPDLILLDMSMPTYDVVPPEKGGDTKPYAGRYILDELKRKRRTSKVIIVTGFEGFGKGEDRRTLEQLSDELRAEFPNIYLGTVFYQASESRWRAVLAGILEHWTRSKGAARAH